jgi:hypothetical protein
MFAVQRECLREETHEANLAQEIGGAAAKLFAANRH